MKSPFDFIVTPLDGKRYNNIKKIGSVDFITSTSEEDFKASNRYAEVVETPIGYTGAIKTGDVLLVHHNVFKFYNDIKGRQRSGRSYFKNISGKTRYSVPFFFATNYDVNIKPLDICVPEGTAPQYQEILAGEYLVSRLNEIYG